MKRLVPLSCFLLATICLSIGFSLDSTQAKADAPDWAAIRSASEAKLPAPQEKLSWRTDFKAALAEAAKSNRPLFVTIRCLPCKQCKDIDSVVHEGKESLGPVLRQFVTVRLTTMRDIDANYLPWLTHQDMDTSWWGYMLSPEARLYSVYGGVDIEGDKSRISAQGLQSTLEAVLNFHYDPRRTEWLKHEGLVGDAPDTKAKPFTPLQHDGWKSWKARGFKEASEGECLHCHQVNEIVRQPLLDKAKKSKKAFDKSQDFYIWPYPESLGLTLARDSMLRVIQIAKDSAAAKAGLKEGDQLIAARGRLLFSEADLRTTINALPMQGNAKLSLDWKSEGEVKNAELQLKKDWRHHDMGWRKSVAEADIGANHGFPWPLKTSDKKREARGIAKGTMAITPWMGKVMQQEKKPAAVEAGLRGHHVITAVNGKNPDLFGRSFLVWFRLNHEVGEKITLTIVDGKGNKSEISYDAPGRAK